MRCDGTRHGPALPAARRLAPSRLLDCLASALDDLGRGLEAVERDQIVLGHRASLAGARRLGEARLRSDASCAFAVEKARQFLDAHFARTVASEELEGVTGLSRYALARHFRARLGTSPIAI